MMTVHEVAKLAGISVRTLHYYDEIGLLRPDGASYAGYRLYGDSSIERLQQILFFRELGFPLGEIAAILNAPNYDKSQALLNHRRLLTLKRERLNGLIALVDQALKGEDSMSIKEFDMKKIDEAREQYAAEAKSRWGETNAYKESEKRTAKYTKEDWARMSTKSEVIFKGFAEFRNLDPASEAAQSLVRQWKAFISDSYYDCTDEILSGLGEMYVDDARFTKNIDAYGEGTAMFMRDAIRANVKGK